MNCKGSKIQDSVFNPQSSTATFAHNLMHIWRLQDNGRFNKMSTHYENDSNNQLLNNWKIRCIKGEN